MDDAESELAEATATGGTDACGDPSLRLATCWSFYWPLALTAATVIVAGQLLNGSLRFYADPTRELAILAIALSIFQITGAFIAFLSQTVNVLADSRQAQGLCLRFTLGVGTMLSACLAGLAFTPLGHRILDAAYAVDAVLINRAQDYLRLLVPLPALLAVRHYLIGLLVQGERTGVVTVGNLAAVAAMVVLLVAGVMLGLDPSLALPAAMLGGECTNLGILLVSRPRCRERPGAQRLRLKQVLGFFLPTSATTIMYAGSRPVIYAFASRLPDSEATIAGLRLGFDLVMLFHFPLNQFRHVMVTYGRRHLPTVRRFLALVTVGDSVLMLAVALSPLAPLIFGGILGAEPEVLPRAWDVLLMLTPMPLVITLRNYYHGHSLLARSTLSLGVGAFGRIGIIALLSALGAGGDWLDARACALILLAGFVFELGVAWFAVRSRRRDGRIHPGEADGS